MRVPRPAAVPTVAGLAVGVVLAGCSVLQPTFRPRAGGTGISGVGVDPTAGMYGGGPGAATGGRPAMWPDSAIRATGRRKENNLDERRVCRTSASPSGWIAVGYEHSTSECPARAGRDSVANVAVLARYEARPIGARLDVCADQPTPAGWNPVDDPPGDPNACPGAARAGEQTTRQIRRVY